jgi:hypothetical protein
MGNAVPNTLIGAVVGGVGLTLAGCYVMYLLLPAADGQTGMGLGMLAVVLLPSGVLGGGVMGLVVAGGKVEPVDRGYLVLVFAAAFAISVLALTFVIMLLTLA